MTEERIVAKKEAKKARANNNIITENRCNLKAAAMKILVNAVFGKLNYSKYWLCDLLAMLKVTINGQLYLLMLIEQLYQKGIKTAYANTDGITCFVNKDQEGLFKEVYSNWEIKTKFELEMSKYDTFFQQDCNNYLILAEKNKIKAKGRYDWRLYAERYGSFHVAGGFKCPIVPYAVEQYFIHQIPIEQTLRQHTNILDFCICGKIGKQFVPILRNTVTGDEQNQQQVLRYFVAYSSYKLIKRKQSKKEKQGSDLFDVSDIVQYENSDTYIAKGRNIELLNIFNQARTITEYAIDYEYYIKECQKLINAIESNVTRKEIIQETLFDLTIYDNVKPPHEEKICLSKMLDNAPDCILENMELCITVSDDCSLRELQEIRRIIFQDQQYHASHPCSVRFLVQSEEKITRIHSKSLCVSGNIKIIQEIQRLPSVVSVSYRDKSKNQF